MNIAKYTGIFFLHLGQETRVPAGPKSCGWGWWQALLRSLVNEGVLVVSRLLDDHFHISFLPPSLRNLSVPFTNLNKQKHFFPLVDI